MTEQNENIKIIESNAIGTKLVTNYDEVINNWCDTLKEHFKK